MNRFGLLPSRLAGPALASALWLLGAAPGGAMTYYLVDNGSWWPADARARIVAAMDEAVATFNANCYLNVNVRVNYNTGIPTAQSNYNGEVGFGGNAGYQTARVALHEICHYVGTGTTAEWNNRFTSGIWTGAAARHFMKLFDGPGAEINLSGYHFWPYGLNYDNEDSPMNRIRMVKLVAAMRFDMGGNDGDGDGMPDDWEIFKMGRTSLGAAGDPDGDGISNIDEWRMEGDPLVAAPVKHGHIYAIRARHSQKVMEAADLTAGANVRQNTYTGSPLQQWTATYVGGGGWKFINLASGHALETGGWSNAAGGNIIQWTSWDHEYQKWRLVPDGAIYSKIFNKGSMNLAADVEGGTGATADLANIMQFHDILGGTNQDWAFDDVTPGEPGRGLAAEYKLDGNARDFSGRGFNGVAAGGITYTTVGRVDGFAATFNGAGGSIEIPATVDANFTLACWIKTTATGGTGQWYEGLGLIDAEVGGVVPDFGLALVGNRIGFGAGKPDYTLLSATTVNDGAWHHVAATRDDVTGGLRIYIDGVLDASGSGPAGARTAPAKMRLGSIRGTTGFFNGSLDEVRIYPTILSQTEITRLAKVASTLVARYAFDDDARDASGHRNHGDPVNVAYTAGAAGGKAAVFDGAGSFVKIPASVVGNFTIAYWVRTTATGGTGQWYAGKAMVDADVPGAADDWGIALVGGKAGFGIGNPDTTIVSTTAVNDGAWHHIAATRTSTSGAMKLYVDGVLQASAAIGPTAGRTAAGGIRVGSTLFGGAYFQGAIDDLLVFNYALNATQVAAIAAPLPAPWASTDIGTPGSDGYAGYAAAGGGTFAVAGSGTDIAGTSDQFHFVAADRSGDQCSVTRLDSIPVNTSGGTSLNAKASLMFRDSTAADSAFVDLAYDYPAGLRFRYREAAGAAVSQVGATVPVAVPCWLKLARTGNTFAAAYATTTGPPAAADWIPLGARDTVLVASPKVGLAVTSHNAALVATAAFSNLQVAAIPSTPGELWRLEKFGDVADTGDAADDADPDHDGIVNLLERALGLEPRLANGPEALPAARRDQGDFTLTYTKSLAATDLTCQVVWSNTLVDWSAEGVIDVVTSSTDTSETHLAKVPIGPVLDPRRGFLRLQVGY